MKSWAGGIDIKVRFGEVIHIKEECKILAEKIWQYENDGTVGRCAVWKQLTDGVRIVPSIDGLCWYLWKLNPVTMTWDSFKIIPRMQYSQDGIEKLLRCQRWVLEL